MLTTRTLHLLFITAVACTTSGCTFNWSINDPPASEAVVDEELLRLQLLRKRVDKMIEKNDRSHTRETAERRLVLKVALRSLNRAISERERQLESDQPPPPRSEVGSLRDVLRKAAESVHRTRTADGRAPKESPEKKPPEKDLTRSAIIEIGDGEAPPPPPLEDMMGGDEPEPEPTKGACDPGDPLCIGEKERRADEGVKTKRDKISGRHAAAVVSDSSAVNMTPVIQRHFGQMTACVPPEQLRGGGLKLQVKLRLATDGSFRDPLVNSASPIGADAKSCIVGVLGSMRLPSYNGPSKVVSIPLWLSTD